jgi:hypothetical protein
MQPWETNDWNMSKSLDMNLIVDCWQDEDLQLDCGRRAALEK